jgi:hypothetical protein
MLEEIFFATVKHNCEATEVNATDDIISKFKLQKDEVFEVVGEYNFYDTISAQESVDSLSDSINTEDYWNTPQPEIVVQIKDSGENIHLRLPPESYYLKSTRNPNEFQVTTLVQHDLVEREEWMIENSRHLLLCIDVLDTEFNYIEQQRMLKLKLTW